LTTFEDYREAIEDTQQAGISALNGEEVDYFAKSSGSLGGEKYFPWTSSFFRQLLEGMDNIAPLRRPDGDDELHLQILALNPTQVWPSGLYAGYGSSHLKEKPLRTDAPIPKEVYQDSRTYQQWLPLYALAADLTLIGAAAPTQIQAVIETIDRDRMLFLDVLEGKREMATGLVRPRLTSERLEHLRRILSQEGPLIAKELWPRLVHISAWQAGTAGPQLDSLKLRLGPGVTCFDAPYCASEGPVSGPIKWGGVGGPIHPGVIIHEFLPLDAEPVAENLLAPWELEEGELYEIVFTTKMGLVRYRIGDVVRCTGFLHRTPLVEFHSRATREISFGVVTISEGNLVEALRGCGRAIAGQWVFGPNAAADGLSLYTTVPSDDDGAVAEQLDLKIRELYRTYDDFRGSGWLAALTLAVLSEDHPLWKARAPVHGQQKPAFLWQQPVQPREDADRGAS